MIVFTAGRLIKSSIFLVMVALASSSGAVEVNVAGNGDALRSALHNATDGDVLLLNAGLYEGNFEIDKSVTLRGTTATILDAKASGDVVRVTAPNVVISGITIRRSGMNLTDMNAGIFVERQASGVVIEGNVLEYIAFGIWLDGCESPRIRNNKIRGDVAVRSQDRGNGIHLYAVHHGEVIGNEVWEARDGIYIDTSNENTLEGNYLHDLRYGIHYMYSYSNNVVGNRTRNTRTGYALMQSKYLTVLDNVSEEDRNYGILMNFITHSTVENNRVDRVKEGSGYAIGGAGVAGAEGKAIFIYNSQFNVLQGNRFAGSDIGIHLTAGSEDNRIYANSFTGNRVQVKYVANRLQEWSFEGYGNYWSDYLGWDLNGDGIGDNYYEPNDAVDKLLWKYPLARILMNSPAVETLRWAQEQFPVLKPQGVRDSQPLMREPSKQKVPS